MHNHQKLVSVIIIFLNEDRFLDEAIRSVLNQTYPNWELLLVDDGSVDSSTATAKKYASAYPQKINYLEHPNHENRGMSASRNLGVAYAKGKYISYLDGDDVWLPNKLERQLQILNKQPEAVMVYGPLLLWHSWTGKPGDEGKDQLYGLEAFNVRIRGDALIYPPRLASLFIRHTQLIPSGILIKKQTILDVGGYEEIFRGHYEDAVLLTKVCIRYPVYVSSECWYKYRQHPKSSTAIIYKTGQEFSTYQFFLQWLKQYLKEQKVADRELWQALEVALNNHRPVIYRFRQVYRLLVNGLEAGMIGVGRKILPGKARKWLWDQWMKLKVKTK